MADITTDLPQARTRPVFARHASSLLLVRHAPTGPEVLMGIRAGGHRFLPNRLVFPGGAVDLADRAAPAATEPQQPVLDALRRSVGPRLARGIVMAAARELREETGLSFGIPPRLDGIAYLCRAITPTRSPIRFNARFLVADAAATTGEPADSGELLNVRFVPLSQTPTLDLMTVTRWALLMLTQWLELPPDQRHATSRMQIFRGERAQPERR